MNLFQMDGQFKILPRLIGVRGQCANGDGMEAGGGLQVRRGTDGFDSFQGGMDEWFGRGWVLWSDNLEVFRADSQDNTLINVSR